MHLNLIFPTLIGIESNFLSESEHEHILNNCYSLKNEISLQHDRWASAEKSPLNSYASYQLHKDINFSSFFNKVNSLVNNFAVANEDNKEYECTHSWFNIYNNDTYQEPHFHRMNIYSVVYYAKAPEGSGTIAFMNPVCNEMTEGAINFGTVDIWPYTPQENTAIIFRSNIAHYVSHGRNTQDRVSIAANYALSVDSYKKITGLNE